MTSHRALLSVSDKTGIAEFGDTLVQRGWEILSTGGTARVLAAAGVPVTEVSSVTGHPEMMDGRVKTLHPAIHAGVLARRDHPDDMAELARQGYAPINLVAVNLYPFRETVAAPDVTPGQAMENLDIGGPTLIRAAAKNHRDVWVVVDPSDYGAVLEALGALGCGGADPAADATDGGGADPAADATDGGGADPAADATEPASLRRRLAAKVFREVSSYDRAVAEYLAGAEAGGGAAATSDFVRSPNKVGATLPAEVTLELTRRSVPRYGENPDQEAGFYSLRGAQEGIAGLEQLHGKELSYNNMLDLDGALLSLAPFAFALEPAVCIIKHTTPCGVALRPTLAAAFERARATDPVSAFGSVIAVNRPVDADTAAGIGGMFVECVVAPGFTAEALEVLTAKKNIRLLRLAGSDQPHPAEPVGSAAWMALDGSLRAAARILARSAGESGGADSSAPGPAGALSFRSVHGGVLFQSLPDPPFYGVGEAGWRVVGKRPPTDAESADLSFAWAAVASVKSNAILLAKGRATVGIGAGQTSRVDSSRLAVRKAKGIGLASELEGCALASDAFFPFRDGVDAAAEAGAGAIIQPGGSIRDDEVVAAADEHGIAMIFTGRRLFRH